MSHFSIKSKSNMVIEYLATRYPFINSESKDIFITTMKSCLSNTRNTVIEYISALYDYTTGLDKNSSTNVRLGDYFASSDYDAKYYQFKIYNRHNINELELVKFAINFFDKPLDDFIEYFKFVIKIHVADLKKFNNFQELKKEIEHTILCHYLLAIGRVFFHFKLSIETGSTDNKLHEKILNLVKKITKRHKYQRYENDIKKIYDTHINSKVTERFNNFKSGFEKINKWLAPAFVKLYNYTEDELIHYMKNIPDITIKIEQYDSDSVIDYVKNFKNGAHLLVCFLKISEFTKKNNEPDLFVHISKIDNDQKIVIEI